MSRILRRPMFRGGGPVNSYGTGITAPLVPGYEGGGQIGGGTIYGIPHADGRYGFRKIPKVDFSGITGVNTKSGSDLLYESGAIAPRPVNTNTVPGVADENDELTQAEILANQKAFNEKIGTNTWDEYITIEGGKRGSGEPRTIKNPNYKPPMKTITIPGKGRIPERTVTVPETEADIKKRTTTTLPGQETIYSDEIIEEVQTPDDGDPTLKETEEALTVDPKTMMEENAELFKEMLGIKKARGQDISDMLLRFSGSQGDTLGEKFQNYTALEAAAGPGRAEQIGKTAAGLSIQDWIAGKRSAEQIDKLKEVETWRSDLKAEQYTIDKDTDSFSEALDKTVLKYGGKEGKADSVSIIAETIKKLEPGVRVYNPDINPKSIDKIKPKDLGLGLNIVVLSNGQKYVIRKNGPDDFELVEKYSL
jgi:hypothetical protein